MTDAAGLNPGVLNDPDEPKLRFFSWAHLPPPLQEISRGFGELALWLCENVARSAERTLALNELLAAKDWAVRAALPPAPAYPLVRRSDQGERLGTVPSYDEFGPASQAADWTGNVRVVGGSDTIANPSRIIQE